MKRTGERQRFRWREWSKFHVEIMVRRSEPFDSLLMIFRPHTDHDNNNNNICNSNNESRVSLQETRLQVVRAQLGYGSRTASQGIQKGAVATRHLFPHAALCYEESFVACLSARRENASAIGRSADKRSGILGICSTSGAPAPSSFPVWRIQ